MKPKTWYAISAKADTSQTEISIFDEIGFWGISAKQFISDLKNVPANHQIVLRIHSPGGEVFDGNAIANALKRHPGGYVAQIEGLAASMATVISLGGQPVKMAENGFYMIHNPWGMAVGDAADMRDQAELLDKIQTGIVNAYAAKSGQTPEQIQQWMDSETWFTAQEAKDAGFVDEITDPVQMAASANQFSRLAKFKNAPANLTTPENVMSEETATIEPVSEIAPNDLTVTVETSVTVVDPEDGQTVDPAVDPESPDAPAMPEDSTPETPVAVIPGADAILAKYNAVVAECNALKVERDNIKAELVAERTALQNLERSLGVAAAINIPVIAAETPDNSMTITRDQLAQMTIKEQNEFFRNGGKLS
jgi:ATP-dependent Clp endopeptidase proteolytic subunit ClpP